MTRIKMNNQVRLWLVEDFSHPELCDLTYRLGFHRSAGLRKDEHAQHLVEHFEAVVGMVIKEKLRKLCDRLQEKGLIAPVPSDGNVAELRRRLVKEKEAKGLIEPKTQPAREGKRKPEEPPEEPPAKKVAVSSFPFFSFPSFSFLAGGSSAAAEEAVPATSAGASSSDASGSITPSSAPDSKDSSSLGQQALKRVLKRVGAKRISVKEQLVMYMGNCTEALDHFKEQKKNKVTTTDMRTYFKTVKGAKVWTALEIGELGDYEFDHIHPLGTSGGYDYPYNYFVMPKSLNDAKEFKNYGMEKQAYIGPKVAKDAENFMKWIKSRAEHMIDMADFDKVRLLM